MANMAGIGGIAAKIRDVIKDLRKPIDKAIEKVVGFVVDKARALMGRKEEPATTEEKESPEKTEKVSHGLTAIDQEEQTEWHHIVEQSQIQKSGFNPKLIHNAKNIIAIDSTIHVKISGYYSSKPEFTRGKTIRDWLAGQSYQEQYQFGLNVLKRFGISKYSSKEGLF